MRFAFTTPASSEKWAVPPVEASINDTSTSSGMGLDGKGPEKEHKQAKIKGI